MNSLFTSSWAKNVKPSAEALWDLQAKELLAEAKKGRVGDPRYSKLMGMQSVKELKGTMTPRYFVTKVLKHLEQNHPDKKLEDLGDKDIESAMNLVANVSRKLVTNPDVKFSTAKAEDVKEKLKKGKTGFETLNLNLDPETVFKFHEESPLGYEVYTVEKDGLKYRVTLKQSDGNPVKLSDITSDNVASVVVVQPSQTQTVSVPTLDDMESPKISQEKPVADFPPGDSGDFSGPDPEELAYGKDDEDAEDEEMETEDGAESDELDDGDELDMSDDEDSDELDMSGEEDYEDEKDDDDSGYELNNPKHPKFASRFADKVDGDRLPGKSVINVKESIVIKKSPQSINKELRDGFRKKMQSRFSIERRNTTGF
jgi:hypothetical protein